MKRRSFGASGLLGLVLAAVLSANALAASFSFTTLKNVCETSGGDYGFGYVLLKVEVKEFGVSGANYFRILSKAQYKNGSGWHTLINYGWVESMHFPNDSDNWYKRLGRRFDPDGTPDALAHRIWMRVQVWSNSQGLLAERIMKNLVPDGDLVLRARPQRPSTNTGALSVRG